MSSHNNNSTSANDPRQPSAAKPYVAQPVSPQDLPVDYSGFIAVIFGIAGVMFRYKLSSWLAIIFCAQSLANMKNVENDLKQISMAMIFVRIRNINNGNYGSIDGPVRPSNRWLD
ncbi:protein Asterix [Gossypium australe]|uniref:Protein Asterix n=1 Tax=Gossypium australe TaxID=47621 RepID=A0A5B6UR81_9ROSI|nr:protein Asterix [Gossypium australe]